MVLLLSFLLLHEVIYALLLFYSDNSNLNLLGLVHNFLGLQFIKSLQKLQYRILNAE